MPAILILLVGVAVPIGYGIYLAFTSKSLVSAKPPKFVGLDNYRSDVFTGDFRKAVLVTLIIAGLGLAIQIPVGLALALILSIQLRGHQVFRTALMLPMLLTPVAVGLMWRFMLNADLGIITYVVEQLHLGHHNFLSSQWGATLVIVGIDSWQNLPFVMLMFLAALLALPADPLEAAAIDGARPRQILAFVALPMLLPVIVVTFMLRMIDALRLFDIVYVVTGGGPGNSTRNVGFLSYQTSFQFFATGRGAAIAVAIVLLLLPFYLYFVRESAVS